MDRNQAAEIVAAFQASEPGEQGMTLAEMRAKRAVFYALVDAAAGNDLAIANAIERAAKTGSVRAVMQAV